jgi:hypothetical protein
MPPQRRKRKVVRIDEEPVTMVNQIAPSSPPPPLQKYLNKNTNQVIKEQDDDYELSIIMDMIKMQQQQEIEKEKERIMQEEKERKIQEEKISTRDQNIKEVLRRIKTCSQLSAIEKTIIQMLEHLMETCEMQIILEDVEMYEKILTYLGIDGRKGTIRLSNEIKEFIKSTFILKC